MTTRCVFPQSRESPAGLAGAKVVIGMVIFALGMWLLVVLLRPDLGQPEEALRQHHPAGFSMILPHGWQRDRDHFWTGQPDSPVDAMSFFPEKQVGRTSSVTVLKTRQPDFEPIPRDQYRLVSFQGQDAWVFDGERRQRPHYRIVFERDGQWYVIAADLPLETAGQIGQTGWVRFFETFRVEQPTPAPAAVPVLE